MQLIADRSRFIVVPYLYVTFTNDLKRKQKIPTGANSDPHSENTEMKMAESVPESFPPTLKENTSI